MIETAPEHTPENGVWWVVEEMTLLDMLRRVAAGEDPEIVYMQEYANCREDDGE